MKCKYADNEFCKQLKEETREVLCKRCHFLSFKKGTQFPVSSWKDDVVLMLDGLLITGELDIDGNKTIITNGISSCGKIISSGGILNLDWESSEPGEIIGIHDFIVAVFDKQVVKQLFDSDISFIKTFLINCLQNCGHDNAIFMREIGNKDSYSAVRFVVLYCKEIGVPLPTHEQIAWICNRRRATVTEVLHKLVLKEPELFQ